MIFPKPLVTGLIICVTVGAPTVDMHALWHAAEHEVNGVASALDTCLTRSRTEERMGLAMVGKDLGVLKQVTLPSGGGRRSLE